MIKEQVITKIIDLRLTTRKHIKIASNCKEKNILFKETAKSFARNLVSYKGKNLNMTKACKFRLMIQATRNCFSQSLRKI